MRLVRCMELYGDVLLGGIAAEASLDGALAFSLLRSIDRQPLKRWCRNFTFRGSTRVRSQYVSRMCGWWAKEGKIDKKLVKALVAAVCNKHQAGWVLLSEISAKLPAFVDADKIAHVWTKTSPAGTQIQGLASIS